jgi:hypothetical protein
LDFLALSNLRKDRCHTEICVIASFAREYSQGFFASYAIIGSERIAVLVAKAMAISSAVKARLMQSNLVKSFIK